MTLAEVGGVFAFFSVGAAIGSFSAGAISNGIGRRKPLIFIPGFLMPVLYLIILSVSPAAWVPLLMILGFMTSVVVPMVLTFPFDLGLSPREVAVGVGLVRTVTPMGSAIGPPLVGLLQESTGSLETALYWVLPASVTVGVIGLLLPETSPLRKRGDGG
jgi:MFS family permease